MLKKARLAHQEGGIQVPGRRIGFAGQQTRSLFHEQATAVQLHFVEVHARPEKPGGGQAIVVTQLAGEGCTLVQHRYRVKWGGRLDAACVIVQLVDLSRIIGQAQQPGCFLGVEMLLGPRRSLPVK